MTLLRFAHSFIDKIYQLKNESSMFKFYPKKGNNSACARTYTHWPSSIDQRSDCSNRWFPTNDSKYIWWAFLRVGGKRSIKAIELLANRHLRVTVNFYDVKQLICKTSSIWTFSSVQVSSTWFKFSSLIYMLQAITATHVCRVFTLNRHYHVRVIVFEWWLIGVFINADKINSYTCSCGI